jgi:hemerythrin
MRASSLRLEWIPALATDSSVVDDQHRHLFDLYNQVLESQGDRVDRDGVLDSLTAYALHHFRDEEAWMESIGYPQEAFLHHKSSHEVFVRELERLRTAPLYQTLDYFREWLLRHIMAEDRQIRVFLSIQKNN